MSIRANCAGCGRTLNVADKFAGKRARCPVCQGIVQIPGVTVPPPEAAPQAAAADEDSDSYSLPQEFEQPDAPEESTTRLPARTVGVRRRPRADEYSGGTDERRAVSRESPSEPVEGDWRDHLVWMLLLALIPLALSIIVPETPTAERILETISQHPDIGDRLENVHSKQELFSLLPDRRIVGAHLPWDTQLHWGYAIISAAAFLGVLTMMLRSGDAGPLRLLGTGLLTGTVGIFLLLAFQWFAFSSMGVMIRGRGILVLLFYLVKLIGFSYHAALNPENGFVVSFLGFTAGVGLCEELCKALPGMFFLRGSGNVGWRTACLVGMASGVGFGVSEGITYSSDYYNGLAPFLTYLVRFLSCVSLHAIWAGAVALMMRENQDYLFHDGLDWGDAGNFIVHYLSIAMVLHGLYDTLLKREQPLWALAIAVGSFAWLAWLIHNRRQAEAE